jgi:hypothetical protein
MKEASTNHLQAGAKNQASWSFKVETVASLFTRDTWGRI